MVSLRSNGKPKTSTKVPIAYKYESLYDTHKSNSAVFHSLGLPAGYWIDRYEASDLSNYYKPRQDVVEVLQVLGLFTNNKLAVVKNTLQVIGIPLDTFTKMITGDEVKERKPKLHGFELMLQRAACQPSDLIYIGDRYHVDVEPAQRLGAAGGLVWSMDERADFNFPQFTDLLTLNT